VHAETRTCVGEFSWDASQGSLKDLINTTMKLKIKITGSQVHDVGYRYFLMSNALDLGLKGFNARNRMSENEQEVIALVEGDDDAIADFKKLVQEQKPERSEVSKITFEDYDEDVMKVSEYAQVCTALQMNKAIPILLEIRDSTESTPLILEEVKGLREDVQPGFSMQFRQMQADVRAIKERLGMT
jgi:acylphosphatase